MFWLTWMLLEQAQDGIQHHDKLPAERDPIQRREQEKYAQRHRKVDDDRHIFGQDENVFGDIDLGNYRRVSHQGKHSFRCRFTEK